MKIWTTFCPSKICWELSFAKTKGKSPTSNWLANKTLIESSLKTLKTAGISGLRLVIFPSELTQDGTKFDWFPIETLLDMCKQQKFTVTLCIGPFQYPNYPGIYLPQQLLKQVFDNENALDTNPELRKFGIRFLQAQLDHYAHDKRIYGFHLGNEWPDSQNISGKEQIKKPISEDFMIKAVSLLKVSTEKPIQLNTNIDALYSKKLAITFTNILTILEDQGYLGLDIYPSQETWRKAFLQKLLRLFIPYRKSLAKVRRLFRLTQLYFAEVEAQPWGNGRAWYTIISSEVDAQQQVLSYSRESLPKTWKKYITSSRCYVVSLWGADFWLVANEMGITWPLEQIRKSN